MLFKITYWELPGKERYLNFLGNYALGACVAIVLFDTTKSSSLERAEKILKSIENCDIPIKFLVCNKMDLLNTKQNIVSPVVQQDAETIAKNLIYYLWEYKKITPENFDKVIINKYNQKNLLKLFEEEQRMIRYRIKHYEEKYNLNLKSYNINDKDYLERSDL